MYLSFDGGGSASRAILFDEDGPIGYGKSGGTNTNFTTMEDCRSNIADCLDQALLGRENPVIEALFATIVGPGKVLMEELRRRAQVTDFRFLGEGEAGLLAGAMRKTGIVIVSGTGSDAFYVPEEGKRVAVGGYGALLGDQGSGTWIGQRALRRAIAYGEGWGEPTLFREMIYEAWKLEKPFDIVSYIHGKAAPFRTVASAVPIVAEAARRGDEMCLSLFKEAGRLLAVQTLALIEKTQPPEPSRLCVCCGGTWKAHPLMYETFEREMRASAPDYEVRKPVFEHVMAGVVLRALEAGMALSELEGPYENYKIRW